MCKKVNMIEIVFIQYTKMNEHDINAHVNELCIHAHTFKKNSGTRYNDNYGISIRQQWCESSPQDPLSNP